MVQYPYQTNATATLEASGGVTQRKGFAMFKKYTPEQRFWNKVDRSGGDDACWIWTARARFAGYGQIWWHGHVERAHRVAYELGRGPIPDGLFVLHSCDNPPCCNPAHLFLGTSKDNSDDMIQKGRDLHFRGEQHGRCKLTDAQVAEIRERYAAGGVTQIQLGAEFGVAHSQISRIVTRKNRQDTASNGHEE